ncbi:nucleoside hydrolase [Acidimicrobiaceae bacterium AH-315-P05]|nr:nucleoside hydrolase [Acidimicrobiaceae bacterium AH-315-P05]
MTQKVIIDTDPGVDDAMAILMALASPEIEVLGLTTVFGNATSEITTSNALTLLETVGRSDIGVAVGEAKPIASDYLGPVPQVHGTNGLGDAELSPPVASCSSESAADLIHRFAVAEPGKVTLLALGPLTNLAVALKRYPGLPKLIERVVVMGGNALVPGNATPVAEANINNDPEAADLVFGAGWPVTMVGLDVTHQINLTGAAIERITGAESAGARLLRQALPLYRNFFETMTGIDGIYLHDPSTVAYLLDPHAFTVQRWPIRVETESFSRGKTWPNLGETDDAAPAPWLGRPLIDVCTGVDADRVIAMVVERLARSA